MEQSSQTREPRVRRPWTDEDQRRAEELRKQGLSLAAIAKDLSRGFETVRCRLDPIARQGSIESRRRWAQRNPERQAESVRRWVEANREWRRKWERGRYHLHRQKHLDKMRRWKDANREHTREFSRRWRRENRQARCEQARRRRAMKLAAVPIAAPPITREQIWARFALFGNRCAYCGELGQMTVDHVLALTAGGLDDAPNIVPACLRCNSGKRERPVEEWYRRQPFFSSSRWRRIQRHCPDTAAGQLPLVLATPKAAQKQGAATVKGSTTADSSGSESGTGGEAAQAV